MYRRPIRILTNIQGLDQSFLPDVPLSFSYMSSNGSRGAMQFIFGCVRSDLIILNIDTKKLMLACALKWVLPMLRFRIVSVDLILRTPKSRSGRLKAFFKKLLFKKVYRFILFFRDLRGCERFYGVGPDRTIYVPFKVNGWEQIQHRRMPTADGDYVLCAGRTLRDVTTFVEAMKRADCPGVLLQQNRKLLSGNGTQPWDGNLPPNVRLVIDAGNDPETFVEYISNARMVVIPRFKHDIAPSGIGTYLLAMALNRCVIISEGPGASDVLTDEAVIVPAEEPETLSERISSLWADANLRESISLRGRKYAALAGGEDRLYSDILRASVQSLRRG